jgi:GntR family transcriptional regulator, carbon starvation induced regulator
MRDSGATLIEPAVTVTETVYRRLRGEILDGALKPGGKLKLDTLKSRYHVSVNTLRETLSRLVADGLVQNEGQRGFTVIPASLADLRDITEMRRMLECEAARRSLERASLEWESQLVAAYHKLSKVEAVIAGSHEKYGGLLEQYNREFHAALIADCGSRWLIQLHGMMYDQSLRYRMLAFQVKDFPREQSRREHREILDAALARDADRLVAVLSAHITKGIELYLDVEAKTRPTMPPRRRRRG